MNGAAQLALFMIFLNLASGMMITLMPEVFNDLSLNPIGYSEGLQNEFLDPMERNVNAEGDLQDPSEAFDRLLDKLNIGWITKISAAINNYLFGFIKILEAVFGASFVWGGFLNILVRIGYVMLVWSLWTGKGFSISD